MKLEAVERAAAVLHGGQHAGFGACERHELIGDNLHLVAVAHPDFGFAGNALEQVVGHGTELAGIDAVVAVVSEEEIFSRT